MQEQHQRALPAMLARGGSVIHSLPRAVPAALASQPSTGLAPCPVPTPSPPSSASYVCSSVVVVINSSVSLLPSWSLGSGVLGVGAISSSSETESWLSKQRQRDKGAQTSSPCPHPSIGLEPGPISSPTAGHTHSSPGVSASHGVALPSARWGPLAGASPVCCGSVGQEPW